jgi:hypothetical protein
MNALFAVLVVLLAWGMPLLVVVYVVRALGTIVAGLRSVNAHTERIAIAVEKLANERESS